jgi:hypothetical protein
VYFSVDRIAMQPPTADPVRERSWLLAGYFALAGLLLLAAPLFLCMGVWSDITHYDLATRVVLHGGVYYRDWSDFNFPGMVWVHVGLRSLLGWNDEPLRLVDLLIVAGNVALLVGWLRLLGIGRAARAWAAVLLFLFYFSTTELAHCQRDMWMLLPCLVALHLRYRQVERLATGLWPQPSAGLWAFVEGLCWGAAVWIKPFVVFPALACGLVSAVGTYRGDAPRRVAAVATDTGGLLLGGLLAGALGGVWLLTSGAWPYFWETVLHSNRGYYANLAGFPVPWRIRDMLMRLWPWGLVYTLTVPVSAVVLVRWLRSGARAFPQLTPQRTAALVLFAAFFAGWFVQVAFVQLHHEYVMAPLILLSLTLLVGSNWEPGLARLRVLAALGLVVAAVALHPLLRVDRLALWGRCWAQGGSPDLRNRLSLTPKFLMALRPDWVALQQVDQFLHDQDLHDGELLCFNTSSIPLYLTLDVQPGTRVAHFDHIIVSPEAIEPLRQELNASPVRFVVSDLDALYHPPSVDTTVDAADGVSLPPWVPREWAETFPLSEPVVFRAGRYRVHRVTGPVKLLKSMQLSHLEGAENSK